MYNGLAEIPRDAFVGMSSLLKLWMRNNRIRFIRSGGFNGLSNVTMITLQGNTIMLIESGAFTSTSSLTLLVLDGSAAPPTLQRGVFSGLTALTQLRLTTGERGRVSTIETGAFSDLTRVTYLSLLNQNLTTLGDRVFANCTLVQVLRLRNNSLTSIGNQTFGGLTFVLTLDLRFNLLSVIADGAFADMSSLSTLRLDNNYVEELTDGALRGLASLGLLNLTFNNMSIIEDGVFDGMTNLASLSIDNNRLTSYASLQSPDLVKLADCTSTLSWFPQIIGDRYGVEQCIVTKGACSGSGDVCRSQASCVSTYGLRSGCCSSSLGACRACTTNASVPLLPVCVECKGCSVVDGQVSGEGDSIQVTPTATPTAAPTSAPTVIPMYSAVLPAGCCRTATGGTGMIISTVDVATIAECESMCSAQINPLCAGFEVSDAAGGSFHCELHMSEISYTAGVCTGCFRRINTVAPTASPTSAPTVAPIYSELLPAGCCRDANGGSGTTYSPTTVATIAECERACNAQISPRCVGYEVTPTGGGNLSCELHRYDIFYADPGCTTVRCFRKTSRVQPDTPRFHVNDVAATCQLLFGGLCFTDGPGDFNSSRRCEVGVNLPGTLTVDLVTESIGFQPFSIISDTDYAYKDGLRVDSTCDFTASCLSNGCDCLDSPSSINGLTVHGGSTIQWNTATSSTRSNIAAGFVLCVLPFWTEENDDSMCPLPSMARA
jgi:Leucine-rich repeat (LRR) protein